MHVCRIWLWAALLLGAAATPAHAEWHVARSKHFIIYADERPDRLRAFSEKLEKFDKAVRHIRNMGDYPIGDGNRLQVYVAPSEGAVRRLANDRSGFVSGFYIPRASGSVAFVPKRAGGGSQWELNPETVFFHEYAHHLMMQELDSPYPEWLVEGFAEFMSTVRFEKDGSVGLGAAPLHRAYGLFEGKPLPLETILSGSYGKLTNDQRESIYGRGWLLAHFLTFEPSRTGQIQRYLGSIAKGVEPLAAARAAFGDLGQLDRDLKSYMMRRKLTYVTIAPQALALGPIEVSRLAPGAAAVVPLRMESKKGVNRQTAEPLAARVRQVAAQFPGDALVETTLAEAELDAGHSEAAEAAADRALKADARSTEAMIYKGRAILQRAESADKGADKLFAEARKWFISANKIDPEDPEPLMEYYKAFLSEGVRPTPNAIAALHYASNLAPQDLGLRMNSAVAYLNEGKLKEARTTLAPVAYSPHGGSISGAARRILARIDAGDARGALQTASAPDPASGD